MRWWLTALGCALLAGCGNGGGTVCVVLTLANEGTEGVSFRAQAFGPSGPAVPVAGGSILRLSGGAERGVGLTDQQIPDGLARVRIYNLDDDVAGNPTELELVAAAGCGEAVRVEFRGDGTVVVVDD